MPTISRSLAARMKLPRKNLQTILIPLTNSLKDAKRWLRDHQFRTNYHRKTIQYHRFMQNNPVEGAHYFSKILPNGIILVWQEY